MKELNPYRLAFIRLPEEICEAEAEAEKQVTAAAAVVCGEAAGASYSELTELFVRASSGSRTGMVYTQNLEGDPREVLQQAMENSRFSQSEEKEPMNRADQVAKKLKSMGLSGRFTHEEHFPMADTQQLKRAAGRLEQELLEKLADMGLLTQENREQVYSAVQVTQRVSTIGLVNTCGLDLSASNGDWEASVQLQLPEYDQLPFQGFLSVDGPRGLTAERFLPELLIWKKKLRPSTQERIQPGAYRVILDASAVVNLFFTAWQLFSGKNYQMGSSALCGCLGEQIASECLSITDRNHTDFCSDYYDLDCEGTPSQTVSLVEQGRMVGLMHNLSTAAAFRSGSDSTEEGAYELTSTGNAGRKYLLSGNIHTEITVMPKIFTVEPGDKSLEEMISSVGDGYYIYESLDVFHSINIASGEYAIPCKAIRIQGGQLTKRMEGLSISGNLRELFQNIEAVGSELHTEAFVMYQSYLVAAPALQVAKVKISG